MRAGAFARISTMAAALLGAALPASAEDALAPPGAASCSGCHVARSGTDAAVPIIAGRPADEIAAAMEQFRTGARPATVMNRIAPGFTPIETRAIAVWLSRQPVPQ